MLLNICHCFHNLNIFQQIDETPDVLSQFGSFFFVVQVKGCKGLAHVENNNLGDGMKIALERFKQSFPALDWEYMNNRKQGELFFDLGVTIHPNHSGPLVGLYRLDSLEASYGASGFNRGNLHTINTLGMFGGLQAETSRNSHQRTHILFRSSYPLYEATRQKDNKRNLFQENNVYARTPGFYKEIKSVQDIFDKAGTKSYGVRDEFRVGGATFELIQQCIDEVVSS